MELKTLFIGNVSFETTEDALLGQFRPYGAEYARVLPDKGIAFVELPADRVQEAIDEKHDSELDGRRLRVNEARAKEQ